MPRGNPAINKPLKLSADLEAVIGAGPLPRGQVMKKIWEYIKGKDLQDPQNRRDIIADDKLRPLFDGKDKVNMFEMTKLLSKHLTSE